MSIQQRANAKKHLPLPRRFAVAMTEDAYARLRALNQRYGLSNNYLLTVLLERLDAYADPDKLEHAFRAMIASHGAPNSGSMTSKPQRTS